VRTDVKKIISERPKANRTWQSNTPRAKAVKLDEDSEQFKEGSNHLLQKHQKMRNHSFNVLERYLAKKIAVVGTRSSQRFARTRIQEAFKVQRCGTRCRTSSRSIVGLKGRVS
jgi:hypothetical protein